MSKADGLDEINVGPILKFLRDRRQGNVGPTLRVGRARSSWKLDPTHVVIAILKMNNLTTLCDLYARNDNMKITMKKKEGQSVSFLFPFDRF